MSERRPVILVVEDNELNLELTTFLLEEAGAEVWTATDATSMWERLAEGTPDLVLMDIQLPGTDGLILMQEIHAREATRDLPVIALTAHAMRGDRERFLEAGCVGYIPKPIEVERFVEQVFAFLPGTEAPGASQDGT